MFFQPKDLVWLDPYDAHRDEEIKQAAAPRLIEFQRRAHATACATKSGCCAITRT
jgi:hypothetical protein